MPSLDDLMLSVGVNNYPSWFSKIGQPNWPMPHQMETIKAYANHTRFLDASEPGTGKTYPSHVHALLMAALGNKVCFTMPPKLLEQFEEELYDFFPGVRKHLKVGNLDCSAAQKDKRIVQWDCEGWPDILLMSYDVYRQLNDPSNMKVVNINHWRRPDGSPYWKEKDVPYAPDEVPHTKDGREINRRGKARNLHKFRLLKAGYNVLFFDEAHALCSVDSILSRSVKSMSDELGSEIAVYLMTGTPVPTHLEDVYGILRLVNPDAYKSFESFKRQHCETKKISVRGKNGRVVKINQICGYKNEEVLNEKLFKNARRVQKRDVVHLPDPVISQIKVRLKGTHAKLYKDIVNNQFAVVGENIYSPDSQAEVRAMALRVIGCPGEFDPRLSYETEVTKAADTYMDSVNPDKHKVIIFAFHKGVIRFLADRYKRWNPAVVYGESSGSKEVVRFKTDPDCRVAVINWVSGGAGLNLQIANNILFYECPTSPKDAKQAISRCDRTGQVNVVNATFLRVMGTVSDKNFKNLLKNEESNNKVVQDSKDLLYELLG